ncbi:PREDICTED: protein TRC8 homolog [Priapulus caudatus]|uniref:Protein TRC8 homolog n=1 Tax=Priapulus caudatus TaxID=37621 RepID=A0ABM1F8B8_PRICU|nr:PREDICTED: protein TRC8 homolog [Priapulus caudatus]
MFLLEITQLLEAYMWIISIGILLASFWTNYMYVSHEVAHIDEKFSWNISSDSAGIIASVVFVQVALACVLLHIRQNFGLPKLAVIASFILPVQLRLLLVPANVLLFAPLAALLLPSLYLALLLIVEIVCYATYIRGIVNWSRYAMRNYGLQAFVENQWSRLQVPHVLRVFWLTRLLEQGIYVVAELLHIDGGGAASWWLGVDDVVAVAKLLLVRGCETVVALLGMTSVVSRIAYYGGCLVQLLLDSDEQEDQSIGTVSAVLFFILALQTGLVGLEPEKRLQRLYRNMCLLATALMHFFHNLVHPLLMSLSASRVRSLPRHGRALAVCALLIVVPSCFLGYLWRSHHLGTWLLAVSAFCVELIIKVVVSLLVYALFIVDAHREDFWEGLDDYVYYIRAAGSTIEFMFGIFLFCNGAWILLFESGGAIRAVMMCIHAYFNIWVQAKEGWRTFMQRRTAAHKIRSLPAATAAQLLVLNDVCSICYQELQSACITQCNHYFHGVCLRKWLYVQDNCPLCHGTIYRSDDVVSDAPAVDQLPDHEHQE